MIRKVTIEASISKKGTIIWKVYGPKGIRKYWATGERTKRFLKDSCDQAEIFIWLSKTIKEGLKWFSEDRDDGIDLEKFDEQ